MKWLIGGTVAYLLLFAVLGWFLNSRSSPPRDRPSGPPVVVEAPASAEPPAASSMDLPAPDVEESPTSSARAKPASPERPEPAKPEEKHSELFEQGAKAAEEKRWTDAIDLFTKAIGERPDYTKAFRNRGYCQVWMSADLPQNAARRDWLVKKGLDDFAKALDLDPSLATDDLLTFRGHQLFRQ